MAEITVAAGQVTTYSGDETELVLRIYCRKNFTTSELEAVVRGGLHSENWYKAVPCTVDENSVVQHEGFTIDSTRDGNPSNSYYTFALYTTAGDFVGRVYKKIIVPATPTTTTLGALAIYSNATALTVPNLYYTAISADAINTLIETLFSAITNATEAAFGLVKLNHAAASVGNPLVVSDNHPMWRAMRETVFLESYGHSQSGVNDALTAIGSTPTVLRISEAIAGTANKTFPSNVLVVLEGNAVINMAASTTWTFETPPVAEPRPTPYFTGDGTVLVLGGYARVDLWTGTEPGNTDWTDQFEAIGQSLEDSGGGVMDFVATGVWRADNILTASPDRSVITVQGRGGGLNALKGTIIKPFSAAGVKHLIRASEGFHDITVRGVTLSLAGSTEIDESRCVLLDGVSPNSAFGIDLDESVTLHSSVMGHILGETKDTAAAGAWEAVGNRIACKFQVPKNGLGWRGGTINTTYKVDNPRGFLGEGADMFEGGFGWLHCLLRDIRGPGSPAPVYQENRTISITASNGSTAITVTSGQLTQNDIGARLYKSAKIDGYIEAVGADGSSCTISAPTTAAMTAEAAISVQWGHLFNRIVAQASMTNGDKTLTLNGATPSDLRFTGADVNRRVEIPGKMYSWIVSVTDAFNAEVYHAATATATNTPLRVYQDGRAGSVIRVTGDHNSIVFDGGAEEGLTWFIKNEVPTNAHPMMVLNGTVQIPCIFEQPGAIHFEGNSIRACIVNDVAGVTGNVSFDKCTLDLRTAIGEDDNTVIELAEWMPFGQRLGDTQVYGVLQCVESGQLRNRFYVPTEYIDTNTNPLVQTPTLKAFNSGITPGGPHRPAFAYGRGNPITGKMDHGYGMGRNYGDNEFGSGGSPTYFLRGGMGFTKSLSQASPWIGHHFEDMPVLAECFIGDVLAMAAIGANQNNYSLGNDHSLFIDVGTTDATERIISGLAYDTIGAGYPFPGEFHFIRHVTGTGPIVFAHQSASSTNVNRIICDPAIDLRLLPGEMALLTRYHEGYGDTDNRWQLRRLSPPTPYQLSKSADYTAILADGDGRTVIYHPNGDDNPRTFTIPANASVPFPIGTRLPFVNKKNTVTIAITTDTLVFVNDSSTGPRTLAANSRAVAEKVDATTWLIRGTSGLT